MSRPAAKRILGAIGVVAVVAVTAPIWALGGSAAGAPAAVTPKIQRVLIVSLPYISWSDLQGKHLPNLDRLFAQSALANLSTRAPSISSDLAGGYATISAGDKAVGTSGSANNTLTTIDGSGFEVHERVDGQPAGQVFARRAGHSAGHGLVQLGYPEIATANQDSIFDAEVGVLGDALQHAGYSRAVIANADGGELPMDTPVYRRYAVTALMNKHGMVPGGRVGRELLRHDPSAPFGVRLDGDVVERAFARAFTRRSVVLVEASDVVRARAYRPFSTPSQRANQFRRSLKWTDHLVGRLLAHVDTHHDAVLVIGPTPNPDEPALTIASLRAPGIEPGLLRSPTTQRSGFVQLIDVAPSVLGLVDVTRPVSMRGRVVEVGETGGTVADRRTSLADVNDATVFRADINISAAIVLIVFESLLAVAAVLALLGVGPASLRRTLSSLVPRVACVLLAYVPVVYLARIFPFQDAGVGPYFAFVILGAIVLGALYVALGRANPLDPLIIGLGVIVAILVVDVVFGSNLLLNSAFGFSPDVAGRFIGFGNVGYAALGAAAMLLSGLLAFRIGGRRGAWIGIAVLAIALIADGAPFWGADVGGVLSMVPAFGLTAMLLLGLPVRRRTVVGAAVVTVAAAAAATGLDMLRPATHRSHLGRLVEQIKDEGFSAFTKVIDRKLQMNLDSITHSQWRFMVPIGLLFVAYLLFWRPRQISALIGRIPEMRATLIGFGILVVLGYALNDSGILVVGVMLAVLTSALAFLTLMPGGATAAPRAARAPASPPRPRRS